MEHIVYSTEPCDGYELIDAGNGEKLERFGEYTLIRPDPQAIYNRKLSPEAWLKADGHFIRTGASGKWTFSKKLPESWNATIQGLTFIIKPSSFKHVGVFPEHVGHWKWIKDIIKSAKNSRTEPIRVLNLFGYTGGATLAAATAGAEVCHVDGSKVAVTNAKNNAELSELKDAPIRYIVDDVVAFLKREKKRGNTYDGVIMDPPSFGRGPKGEVWKIEDEFLPLLDLVKQILSPNPLFVIINGYASGYSPIAYAESLKNLYNRPVSYGELSIKDRNGRLLPAGIFARINFMEKA